MATAGENRARTAETDLERDWNTVSEFLREHPELLRQDDTLLSDLGLRSRDNIIDFGPAALAKIEEARIREAAAREWLEATVESNFVAQSQAQAAVVDIVEATDLFDLSERIDEIARICFDVVGGVLAVEGPGASPDGWLGITPKFVDELIGVNWQTFMGPNPYVHALFPAHRNVVKSVALARLELWDGRHGVMGFGSADAYAFTPDMGTDLIDFVARVVERTALRWPAA